MEADVTTDAVEGAGVSHSFGGVRATAEVQTLVTERHIIDIMPGRVKALKRALTFSAAAAIQAAWRGSRSRQRLRQAATPARGPAVFDLTLNDSAEDAGGDLDLDERTLRASRRGGIGSGKGVGARLPRDRPLRAVPADWPLVASAPPFAPTGGGKPGASREDDTSDTESVLARSRSQGDLARPSGAAWVEGLRVHTDAAEAEQLQAFDTGEIDTEGNGEHEYQRENFVNDCKLQPCGLAHFSGQDAIAKPSGTARVERLRVHTDAAEADQRQAADAGEVNRELEPENQREDYGGDGRLPPIGLARSSGQDAIAEPSGTARVERLRVHTDAAEAEQLQAVDAGEFNGELENKLHSSGQDAIAKPSGTARVDRLRVHTGAAEADRLQAVDAGEVNCELGNKLKDCDGIDTLQQPFPPAASGEEPEPEADDARDEAGGLEPSGGGGGAAAAADLEPVPAAARGEGGAGGALGRERKALTKQQRRALRREEKRAQKSARAGCTASAEPSTSSTGSTPFTSVGITGDAGADTESPAIAHCISGNLSVASEKAGCTADSGARTTEPGTQIIDFVQRGNVSGASERAGCTADSGTSFTEPGHRFTKTYEMWQEAEKRWKRAQFSPQGPQGHFFFEDEDWDILNVGFELHLLLHAVRWDENQADRAGFPRGRLDYYYNKYYRKPLDLARFGFTDEDEALRHFGSFITFDAKSNGLGAVLPEDTPAERFLGLAEACCGTHFGNQLEDYIFVGTVLLACVAPVDRKSAAVLKHAEGRFLNTREWLMSDDTGPVSVGAIRMRTQELQEEFDELLLDLDATMSHRSGLDGTRRSVVAGALLREADRRARNGVG
jgi:hypothetical protein